MKILLIHNFYKSDHQGGEDLVFQNEFNGLKEILGSNNVLSYTVHNDKASRFEMLFNLFFPLKHCLAIRRIVKKTEISVVHLHNDFPLLTLWIFRFLRNLNCVRIQTLHNYRRWCANGILYRSGSGECTLCPTNQTRSYAIKYNCYRNSKLQTLALTIAYSIQDFFILSKEVDSFFCLSQHQKEKLVSFGINPRQLILKPNFVVMSGRPLSTEQPIEKEIDFLYVGRMDESKGILQVLAALPETLRRKFTVIGHDAQLNEIKLKYPEVNFVGKVTNDQVTSYLKRSRFLVNSSLCYETFGLTLVEAMAVGTPVIGFEIGTRIEMIKPKINGFFMSWNSLEKDLTHALEFSDYSRLVEGSLEFSNQFSKKLILEKQIELYKLLTRST